MNAQEVLSSLASNFHLGVLTWTRVLQVILLFLVGMAVIRIVTRLVDRALAHSSTMNTLRRYLCSGVKILLWSLLILMLLSSMGVEITSMIAVLSVAGLAVSLALQNTLSNVAGGMMILAFKPFEVGDYVETDGIQGNVDGIDLVYTTFTTLDNKQIHIPNSQISATKIINYNHLGRRRVELTFNASYDASTQTVKSAIFQAMEKFPQICPDPAPTVHLSAYGDSSISYLVWLWTKSDDYWDVYYGMQEEVRETFTACGVEMTYNHLNVHLLDEK